MATKASTSKKSTLEIKVGNTFSKVAGLKDFSGLGGGSPAILDATDLDSDAKEKLTGLQDEGSVKLTFNYIAKDAGQVAMQNARSASSVATFKLTIPNAGKVYTFDGYVQTFEIMGGVDKIVEASSNVEITGAVTSSDIAASA